MTASTFDNSDAYELLMGRWSRLLGVEFVRFAGIDDGARVLDVGCGTGALTQCVIAALPHAEVVGVDPSAAFVDAARRRVPDPRVRFEVGDAQSLQVPDGAFDCTASMLALNFVPDYARAAGEFRRVTRSGGRVAACVWDYDATTMLRRFWDAVASLDVSAAMRHESRMPLCREGELASLWRSAGLAEVQESVLAIDMRFASFADYWQPFLAGVGPSGAYAASLAPDGRRTLEERLRADLWNDEPERPRTLSARAWAVRGIVPQR